MDVLPKSEWNHGHVVRWVSKWQELSGPYIYSDEEGEIQVKPIHRFVVNDIRIKTAFHAGVLTGVETEEDVDAQPWATVEQVAEKAWQIHNEVTQIDPN